MSEKKMKLLWSKWFYYALITILLLILIALTSYGTSLGIEIAARFLPTFVGLFVTLLIFWIFFDVREKLEWKSVEDRVRKKIGRQIGSIFSNIRMLCEVEATETRSLTEIDWNRESKKDLNDLVNKGVKLNNQWKDTIIASQFSKFFEEQENLISEIEGKYGKFLGSELQTSLLDIEEYLRRLSFEILGFIGEDAEIEKAISDLIAKIAKEIVKLRESGIDIGF
jgi:hypothetical protein